LSGGQRQRISIARAIYNDSKIFILDEATSALDYKTESNITNSVFDLCNDKTLICIAHRISTLKNCDQIIYLDNGTIKASGTYESILTEASDIIKYGRIEK